MRVLLFCISFFLTTLSFASEKILNVFNWAGYMPKGIIEQFEKETGIKVNYSTFESNESLYTKLKANDSGDYDVIVPSSYFVHRMAKQNMLHKLDHARLPNIKNLDPRLLNKSFDPNNQYSLPYLWGALGILINKKYYSSHDYTIWQSLWNKNLKDQILLSDDMRNVFAMALNTLNYSINDGNPRHIEEAYLKLKDLLPNVKIFDADAAKRIFIDEDINIGPAYNGDAILIIKANPNFEFIYPEGKSILWVDCIAIPANAKHLDNAYLFINFILRPEIARKLSESMGYSSPNLAAVNSMSPEKRNDPLVNPPAQVVKEGEFQDYLTPDAIQLYLSYWERLKLSV